MPLSLKMAGDWNLIFDESTETITGPDRAVKEFFKQVNLGRRKFAPRSERNAIFLIP